LEIGHNCQIFRSLVLLSIERLVGFAVYEGCDVIGLLCCQAAGIIPGHVVHDECRPCQYHLDQRVCGSSDCQQRCRTDYHREKIATDFVYREQCRDSQKKWRENNPGYLTQYRATHRLGGWRDFAKSRLLTALHQLVDSVKNNVVLDLRAMDASIWLVSDSVFQEKNNLASAKVIILQGDLHAAAQGQRVKRTSL
jgi:hypothetical protein